MDKARKVFHLMIKKGCAPDISSYNIMINGDREARRIEETMELFHEIFQKGPIADTLTYNTLTQDFTFWVKLIFCQSPWRRLIVVLCQSLTQPHLV
ncbi:hypothetical protein ES332_A10G154400v1 [Gossypium tomentosum]|uniref:Pentacotripeptide-repeat region of PRORP domain-containing protein n=1 Tax=Gossypium tomentosum TaxID=34277 RepID=A0A5D2NQC1_GOSTO|nr:hypothetical protein ES332_A10G154400v1 [Gossypium tomentosum]